jgi:head-tail adaptor
MTTTTLKVSVKDLISPIDIEYKSRTRTDQGGTQVVWLPQISQAYAADRPRVMPAITAGNKLVSVAMHTIIIRWRPNHGVKPGMRVNLGDSTFYYIQTVQDYEQKHEWLVLTCSEIEPGQAGNN